METDQAQIVIKECDCCGNLSMAYDALSFIYDKRRYYQWVCYECIINEAENTKNTAATYAGLIFKVMTNKYKIKHFDFQKIDFDELMSHFGTKIL